MQLPPPAAAAHFTAASVHEHVLRLHQCGAPHLLLLRRAHAAALVSGALAASFPLAGALLLSYAALPDLPSARLVLRHHPLRLRSAFLWNSLSRALSSADLNTEALTVYNRMVRLGVRPDDRTFPFALHAAAAEATAEDHRAKGLELHAAAIRRGHLADVFTGNTLVVFYAACGCTSDMRRVFDEMPSRDAISWNSLISSFLANRTLDDAKKALVGMMRSNVPVNVASLVSLVPACGLEREEGFGSGLHGLALKAGLDSAVNLGNALVDMYGRFGDPEASMKVFNEMPERNQVSWNSAIGCFVHAGLNESVLETFRAMSERGVMPGTITLSSLLPALVDLGYFHLGKEVHGYCIKREIDSDIFIANSLLDMYAKFGFLQKASAVFMEIEARNVVSWNAMIANLVQNGAETEAFRLVIEMQKNGECPNSFTLVNLLPASARMASLKTGKQIHAWSIRRSLTSDLFVSNALIDVYAKCGQLCSARNIFDR